MAYQICLTVGYLMRDGESYMWIEVLVGISTIFYLVLRDSKENIYLILITSKKLALCLQNNT